MLSKVNTRIRLRKDEIATAITNRRYELLLLINDKLESSEGLDKEYFEFLMTNTDINLSIYNEVVRGYGRSGAGFMFPLKEGEITAIKLEKKARKNSKSRGVSYLKNGEWVSNYTSECDSIERKIYELADQKLRPSS